MDKQQKIILAILAVFLVAALIAVIAVASRGDSPVVGIFVPPPFEENVVKGSPDPKPAGYGTMTVNPEFVIGMCARPNLAGTSLGLYFTSPETNTVWMKVRVCDEAGEILAESGLLKPGEYLPTLVLSAVPENAEPLYVTVLSYEPDTYYSEGSVKVELQIAANE